MAAISKFLASDASMILPFNGYGLPQSGREAALFKAMNGLKPGEVLRLFIDQNPLSLIRKLVLRYGSRLIFQYLQNRDGTVIIDFKKVRD